jgi:hypothetical protein
MGESHPSRNLSGPGSASQHAETSLATLRDLEGLFRLGRNEEVIEKAALLPVCHDTNTSVRIQVLVALARYDAGDVVRAISELRRAATDSLGASLPVQFSTAYAHFLRESDFLDPNSLIPCLTRLRQLATRVGDLESLGSLHLAVARVEGARGHYLTSHHHLDLARSLAARSNNLQPSTSDDRRSDRCVTGVPWRQS